MVYEQLLDDTVGHSPRCTFHPGALIQSDPLPDWLPQKERTMHLHGLLLANHRISQEYLRTFYNRARAHIMIDTEDDLSDFWKFVTLQMEWRSCELSINITEVLSSRISWLKWDSVHDFLEQDFLVKIKSLLLSMPKLVSIDIRWLLDPRSAAVQGLRSQPSTDPEKILGLEFEELLKGFLEIRSMNVRVQYTTFATSFFGSY